MPSADPTEQAAGDSLLLSYVDHWCKCLAGSGRRRFTPKAIARYRAAVMRMGADLAIDDPAQLNLGLLERHMEWLLFTGAPHAARVQAVVALKEFFAYLGARGIIESNPALWLRRPEPRAKGASRTVVAPELRAAGERLVPAWWQAVAAAVVRARAEADDPTN